ncbi:phage tail protein [Mesorhizobium sp.]|uniref:phage tail protein n=1 Tax=Mesorhizobium sp. TaxID=1871066 RepID=UPI0011F65F9E|nr:phage tail protein [Mesorhizobium sp.]TIX27745.1 MAG: phage tail protein [Mesorhizobium sp.]
MTWQTFNPPVAPSPGTRNKPEIKLLKADFGDGYTQTSPDGLNHIRRTLSLNWECLLPWQKDQIVQFFEDHAGWEPFYYTPSNENQPVKWTCEDWDDTRASDGFKVSAILKQDFSV